MKDWMPDEVLMLVVAIGFVLLCAGVVVGIVMRQGSERPRPTVVKV